MCAWLRLTGLQLVGGRHDNWILIKSPFQKGRFSHSIVDISWNALTARKQAAKAVTAACMDGKDCLSTTHTYNIFSYENELHPDRKKHNNTLNFIFLA